MWHGPVGHWVINQTPGAHGNDIVLLKGIKSKNLSSTAIFNSPSSEGYVWLKLVDGLCEDNLTQFSDKFPKKESLTASGLHRDHSPVILFFSGDF